jgi:hypothetical protein
MRPGAVERLREMGHSCVESSNDIREPSDLVVEMARELVKRCCLGIAREEGRGECPSAIVRQSFLDEALSQLFVELIGRCL